MDDLVLRVKQIAQYDFKPLADETDDLIIQQGGPGGQYFHTNVYGVVSPMLSAAIAVVDGKLTALGVADEALQQLIEGIDGELTEQINALIAAINDILANSVYSFNCRTGDVSLELADVLKVGGAPINSPRFSGVPTTPIIPDVKSNDTTVANTRWVQRAVNDQINDLLLGHPFVYCFNGRTGNVTLNFDDVQKVLWEGRPAAPTPPVHDRSDRIATTLFASRLLRSELMDYDFEIRQLLEDAYAPLDSPGFRGTPTAPDPGLTDNSDRIATTEWVRSILTHLAAGVLSFNGRTGFVDLELADVTGVGGAPVHNTALTGAPTAPTPPLTDSSTRLATTAFVMHWILDSVTKFNGRSGDVTLLLSDLLNAGGQPRTHVANTAPTPPVVGELWFDDTADRMKMWDGSNWVLTSVGSAQISTAEPADPHQGDLWWDPVSGELFVWYEDPTSAQWVIANTGVGTQGNPGPPGPHGPEGPQGPPGPQGEGIHLKGVVDTVGDLPATGNTPGDMWVTSDGTGYVWSDTPHPGHWVESGVMRGPAGPQGPIGPPGPQGTGLTVKGTVPTQGDLPVTGNNPGDMWIASDTGTGYVWDGAAWVDVGEIQGPMGPQGPPGTPGTPGATGPQGPAGGGASVGATAPSAPSTGDLWFDTAGNVLKIYNGTTWVDSAAGGGLSDASTTGGPYARQGGAWVQIIDDGVF